jgi:hypothetical protein
MRPTHWASRRIGGSLFQRKVRASGFSRNSIHDQQWPRPPPGSTTAILDVAADFVNNPTDDGPEAFRAAHRISSTILSLRATPLTALFRRYCQKHMFPASRLVNLAFDNK